MTEEYFHKYRHGVAGIDQTFRSPYGEMKIIYADWTASGRIYLPIEDRMRNEIMPFVGNTHTESTVTGSAMTNAYHLALKYIKQHVGALESDVIISTNSGMTGVVNKFQRMLGLKLHESFLRYVNIPRGERPVVFITHMEHHSNHTTWLETIADLELINPGEDGLPNLDQLKELLAKYSGRQMKIASVTACSNVSGIETPYYEIAQLMHRHGGLCFVDFACSAPYININMNPDDPSKKLDAIFFSPHKFLGGPGATGILIFDQKLYHNRVPDAPGGGTVDWTNPWGEHKYVDDIESREDGGTPAFLQTIKAALAIKLKEEMGVENMLAREKMMMERLWDGLCQIPNLHILADNVKDRLGIISFYVEDLHYSLAAKLLNDKFGIQVRSGCSCAGTYGHFLLHVSKDLSKRITDKINFGDFSEKPGWLRLSIHPIMTDREIDFIVSSVKELCSEFRKWSEDYEYSGRTNEFSHKSLKVLEEQRVMSWFENPL